MKPNLFAVIIAGGRGERFWPLSTAQRPKQVLSLVGDRSLLAMAVDRLDGLVPPENTFIITSRDLVEVTLEAAPSLPARNVIGEPFGRDTAAACALASAIVKAHDPEAVFCILTADHIMGDLDVYRRTLAAGADLARREETIVTIGLPPSFPSTGFGYIDARQSLATIDGIEFFKAERFVEKPDEETAGRYVKAGHFYWNGGMFIWSVKTFQSALARHQPCLMDMARVMEAACGTQAFEKMLAAEYEKLDRISIDYAIMEKVDNIAMAKGTFRWDDVGAWPALANHIAPDADGNVLVGACEQIDSAGNVVVSRDRLTALIGVTDLVVVHADKATLICHKDRAQDVKRMVTLLNNKQSYDDVL